MAVISFNVLEKSIELILIISIVSLLGVTHILTLNLDLKGLIDYYVYELAYQEYNDGESYIKFENIFKDREKHTIPIDGVWGAIAEDSGLPSLIRD